MPRPSFEELEARILYSADLAPTGLPGWAPSAEVRQLDTPLSDSANSSQQQEARLEIVFVDTRIDNYQRLLDELTRQHDAGRELHVVLIDADQDGVDAISRTLAEQPREAAAVHLITHGEPGRLQIGAATLDQNSIEARQAQIRSWALSLDNDADLLIYGCDVTASAEGQALIERLAQLTGADVAASDDKTGNAEAGGDWLLEYRIGTLETQVAVSAYGVAGWNSVLATYVVTSTADSGANTLRQAIIDANANAGADSIEFAIAGTGTHTISLASVLPTITDTVTLDASTDDSFAANGNAPAIVIDVNGLANSYGLRLSGTADGSVIRGLLIQDFKSAAIRIDSGSSGNVIVGNYLGSFDTSGNYVAGLSNSSYAMFVAGDNTLIGGSTEADRNLILGSGGNYGLFVYDVGATGNRIQGNYFGTDASGNTAIGGSFTALSLYSSGANNVVGGSGVGEGNVLAGYIYLYQAGSGSVIQANRIGVTADGTGVLSGVGSAGIDLSTSSNGISIIDNWIANVGGHGIYLRTGISDTIIDGNRIGTDFAGTANWGNSQSGIWLTGSNNNTRITDNIIAYSNQVATTYDGITVVSGTGNVILDNTIYGTVFGTGGLGIDLANNGVSANDSGDGDGGANNLQNFPVLSWATSNGSDTVTVAGSLNSTAGSYYRIEFFANPAADASGYGEGQIYLGYVNVATDGSGDVSFSTTLSATVPVGHVISATATKSDSTYTSFTDTSEFAQSTTVIADAEGSITVTTTADTLDGDTTNLSMLLANKGADGEISLREAIIAANNTVNGATPDEINFAIAGTGVHTITLTSALPDITDAVILDASSDDSFAVNGNRPAIVLDGNGGGYSGLVLSATADGSSIRGLVITHFQFSGIDIETGSTGNTVAGNYLGNIGASGSVIGTGNGSVGVFINGSDNVIGGTSAADRNVIGGNSFDGVFIGGGSGNQILGNYIGTDAIGNVADGNGQHGVYLLNGATGNTIQNNIIAASVEDGVLISGEGSDGNIVQGNWIGLGADGSTVLGMGSDGIYISGGGDNNLIGGGNPGEGNTVVGVDWAIWLNGLSSGNVIRGNYVGTDSSLSVAGGVNNGIVIEAGAFNNTVGGTAAADRNYVTNSGSYGIDLKPAAGSGNALLGNLIWNNDGLGIDIDLEGVLLNDAGDTDSGANNLQNFPVLAWATSDGAGTVNVSGSLNSSAGSHYRIEFFANPAADGSGYGEGEIYLGHANVVTNASGDATFTITLTATVPVGYAISATATQSDPSFSSFTNTSEFSQSITVTEDALGVIAVTTAADNNDAGIVAGNGSHTLNWLLANKGADGEISLREAIIAANNTVNGATPDEINFAIAGTGIHTITLTSALPDITDAVILDASSDDSFAANGGRPAIVLDGNGGGYSGLVLSATADGSTIRGFVVRDFGTDGIHINAGSDGNTIAGNYVGRLNTDGIDAGAGEGNGVNGIYVGGANNMIGGSATADRNVIAGNLGDGIKVNGIPGSGNQIFGNYIGSDANGLLALGNNLYGVHLDNDAAGNIIAQNIIVANGQDGVQIFGESSDGNQLFGNWIGLGADGTTPLGNAYSGIAIAGGSDNNVIGAPGQGNIIAFSGHSGIYIHGLASGNLIQGNHIGTDVSFTADFGAGRNGIELVSGAFNNVIGGTGAGEGNIIAHSNGSNGTYSGIRLETAGTGNSVLGNSIFDTKGNELGIDLDTSGVTANDAGDGDAGANNLQNFPVLATAATDGSSNITISGTLNSTANNYYRIEFFANPTADSSGHGEGQVYLGFVNVATDGSGDASFSTSFSASVSVGYSISATATRTTDGNYDTFLETSEFSAAMTVAEVNVAPVITSNGGGASASINVAENTTAVTTVTATDTNTPAQTLTYSITGGADQALFSIVAGTGVLTFNSAPNHEAPTDSGGDNVYDVTVQVSDGNGGTDTQTLAVTVTNVNDAPTVANAIPNQNATEDAAFNFQFAANTFNDVDAGDTLTYSAQLSGGGALPAWLSFDSVTRTFSGTPLNADVGTISIDVAANDGHGGTITDTFTITVANTNDAPTVANVIPNQNATEDNAFNFQFAANTFNDVDAGDTLTYSAQLNGGGALPAWLSFDSVTRTFSGTPLNADAGTISIDVTADDGRGGTVTDTFTITVVNTNDAPTVANAIPNQNATEDAAFNFQFAANTFNDVDAGDTLTYSAQLNGGGALPAWLSFDSVTRTFSGTPLNADAGTISIDVTADDGHGGTVTDTFDISVANSNDAPVVVNAIQDQNATENVPLNFTFPFNTFADPDVGDTLTYSAQLSGGGALPGWLSFDALTRTFAGTPANSDVGTISIDVIADDGHGGTITDTFDIVIGNTNDAPFVANPIPNQNATEDNAFSFQFAANTFADPDVGDTLTYTTSALPVWLSFNDVTRTFSGTPTNVDVGTFSVTVTATDGTGQTVNDTFDLIVTNTNDAPTLANVIPDQNASESVAFNFTFAVNTFADPDIGDTLTYTTSALPAWLSFDAVTRAFSGTPLNADVGTISIDVTADDGHGGTASDTFNIVVANAANQLPTGLPAVLGATTANQTLSADTSGIADADGLGAFSYQWLRNGSDIGGATGSTYVLTNADVGANISVRVSYTDGQGTAESLASATVGPVTGVNEAPSVANPIADQNATEDAAFSFQFAANTFADPDIGDTLTYTTSALPSWLSFNADTRTFSGTPLNADTGSVSITVTATDSAGLTDSDSFDIVISNINDAPTTSPLTLAAIAEDSGPRLITQAELLAQAGDVDGDALIASDLSLTSGNGSLINNGNGTWTYNPAANDDTSVSFSYRVSDGAESILNSASLDLTPVNDSPTGLPIISGSALENQTLTALTSDIADADGLGAFGYQWTANGSNISGANDATLALNSTLVGKTISVVVTYQDGNGVQESLGSAVIGPIAALPTTPETPTPPGTTDPGTPAQPPAVDPEPDESGGGNNETSPPPVAPEPDPDNSPGTGPEDPGLPGGSTLPGGAGRGERLPFLVLQNNIAGGSASDLIGQSQTPVQAIRREDVATLLPIPENELVFGVLAQQNSEIHSSRLEEFSLRRLEEEDPAGNTTEVDLSTRTLQIGGLALSTLAAAWAVRMSGIMASLMISVPIWRNVDPLPILHQHNKTRRDWLEDLPEEKDFHTRSDAEDIPSQAEGIHI